MDKPKAIVVGPGQSDFGIIEIMRLAALAAGCSIEFGGPGPSLVQPHSSGRHPHDLLLPLQLCGSVQHTYSQKPLTKRQKRRLRGKERNT